VNLCIPANFTGRFKCFKELSIFTDVPLVLAVESWRGSKMFSQPGTFSFCYLSEDTGTRSNAEGMRPMLASVFEKRVCHTDEQSEAGLVFIDERFEILVVDR